MIEEQVGMSSESARGRSSGEKPVAGLQAGTRSQSGRAGVMLVLATIILSLVMTSAIESRADEPPTPEDVPRRRQREEEDRAAAERCTLANAET
jgi:hypothetical protein